MEDAFTGLIVGSEGRREETSGGPAFSPQAESPIGTKGTVRTQLSDLYPPSSAMPDATAQSTPLHLDHELLNAIIDGTSMGVQMTGKAPKAVGATKFYTMPTEISVIVGLVGQSNGSVTLNMTQNCMLHLASALLCEEKTEVDEEAYDAIMEIGNMVAGSIKDILADSEFKLTHISVPSLILGSSYNVYYTRGISNVSVVFELDDIPVSMQNDRFFTATVSLLRQVA